MKTHIIYLVSGSGRRFGCNKLLEPFAGKPLYLHTLERLLELTGESVTLRVVSRHEAIRRRAEAMGVPAIDCPDSILGASHTIRAGIESIPLLDPGDYLLFVVADQPLLSEKTLERLLALADGTTRTARAGCRGRPGNPVLFSASLAPELLALTGDTGGGAVAKRYDCVLVEVDDPAELADVDAPEDVETLTNRKEKQNEP